MGNTEHIKRPTVISIFIHMIIWLLVLHLEFDLSGLVESFIISFVEQEKYIDHAFLIIPSLIVLFYWNSHYLIPRFLNRKSWWKYLIILGASVLSLLYLGYFSIGLLFQNGYDSQVEPIDFFDHSFILHLIVIGISTSLGISKIAMENAKQKKRAEQKQKEAELKYLNAQFNPHFLYNTLNGIYAQAVEEEAPKTTEAILKLSEIMRYPIKHGLKSKVHLKDEISFIEDYIALQRLRLGEDYPITFEKEGSLEGIEIMPFSLMPLVENAFKYGISQRDKTAILFDLRTTKDTIQFTTKNKINKLEDKASHRTGIENLRLRLNLVYNQSHTLNLTEKDENYWVELILNIV